MSTAPLTEGVRPTGLLAAYDAPGGRALAYLGPTVGGVPLTVPVVGRRDGWTAVLLPSANRRLAWLPPTGWTSTRLTDQVVVNRGTHEVSWYRNGALAGRWTAALGNGRTPTPLGRTFILGRTRSGGRVYAGVDILALGAIPDNPYAVPTGLRGAHIGIHAWYDPAAFGRSVSNGCIRMPRAAQQELVGSLAAGTEVVVLG
jgi:L,D-transpeptidase catalytic domain